jgi:hypothetical protein
VLGKDVEIAIRDKQADRETGQVRVRASEAA